MPVRLRCAWRERTGAPGSRQGTETEPRPVLDPSRPVLDASRPVLDPSRQVLDPSRQILDPSRQILDPSRQILDPSRQILGPSRQDRFLSAGVARIRWTVAITPVPDD
ncbi:hypothetical protein GCM10010365_48430 [Streptomyces poonensis]|uniref:Uncharacterized protein n=1 Tax=Streptomyces poonensis TaxID=68255 RepID=A0A918PTS7_9ACTN|nr:hypothetical protein GCM10010365_48430 [Streptomyces poonensis]GLJ91827.1 hypothetical protein GCM10017589_44350 [Streptomyces poonensis]